MKPTVPIVVSAYWDAPVTVMVKGLRVVDTACELVPTTVTT